MALTNINTDKRLRGCANSRNCGVGSRFAITGLGRSDNKNHRPTLLAPLSNQQFNFYGVGSRFSSILTGLYFSIQRRATGITPLCGVGSHYNSTGLGCDLRFANDWTWFEQQQPFDDFYFTPKQFSVALVSNCGVGSRFPLTGQRDHCHPLSSINQFISLQTIDKISAGAILENYSFFQHAADTCRSISFPRSCTHTGNCDAQLSSKYFHSGLNWWGFYNPLAWTDAATDQNCSLLQGLLLLALLALGWILQFTYFLALKIWHLLLTLISSDRTNWTSTLRLAREAADIRTIGQASGKPGPKSRVRSRSQRCGTLRIFHCLSVCSLPQASGSFRGEGCAPVMGGAEVPFEPQQELLFTGGTKQHDTRPKTGDHAIHWHPKQTRVVKRSIKRAFARACAQGLAWYKGRCYTPNEFPKNLQLPVISPALQTKPGGNPAVTACNRKHRDARRLSLLTWNAGGLNSAKLDEIKIWLEDQQIDAAVLTETRMPFEAEWVDEKWLHIHTGTPADKWGGVFCLVSRRICTAQQLKWQPVVEGRLQLKHRNEKHPSLGRGFQHQPASDTISCRTPPPLVEGAMDVGGTAPRSRAIHGHPQNAWSRRPEHMALEPWSDFPNWACMFQNRLHVNSEEYGRWMCQTNPIYMGCTVLQPVWTCAHGR